MDDTTRSVLDRITKRFSQETTLATGHCTKVFFDTVQLSPNDLARLAAQATGGLEHSAFDLALGIAYNGIFFAAAVAGGRQVAILQADGKLCGPSLAGKKVVIVSDIVVSGKQLYAGEKIARQAGAQVVGYVCIVDRSNGQVGTKEQPLYSASQLAL